MSDFRDFRVFFRYAILNGKSIFFQENGPYDLKFATDISLGICNNDKEPLFLFCNFCQDLALLCVKIYFFCLKMAPNWSKFTLPTHKRAQILEKKIQNTKSGSQSLLQIPKGMSVANFRSYGPFSRKKIDFPFEKCVP